MKRWSGTRATALTRQCLAVYGTDCHLRIPGVCVGRATTADHVIPRALDGPDTIDNLRPACLPCNQHKSNRYLTPAPAPPSREW